MKKELEELAKITGKTYESLFDYYNSARKIIESPDLDCYTQSEFDTIEAITTEIAFIATKDYALFDDKTPIYIKADNDIWTNTDRI